MTANLDFQTIIAIRFTPMLGLIDFLFYLIEAIYYYAEVIDFSASDDHF